MTNDDKISPQDTKWRHAGHGQMIGFRCGKCDRIGCDTKGSGMRKVRGLKTKVCSCCRAIIDERTYNHERERA